MDPDEALRVLRESDDLIERATAALELDRWIFSGGFLPRGFTPDDAAALNAWRVATVDALNHIARSYLEVRRRPGAAAT